MVMNWRNWMGTLTVLGLLTGAPAAAEEIMPLGEIDKVTIRARPNFPAVETELTGAVGTDWEKGFRKCARYTAYAQQEVRWPIIVVYPEWEGKDPEAEAKMQVRLILDPDGSFPVPKQKGLATMEIPATSVASYAYRGDYSAENVKTALAKVRAFLKANNIPEMGPPEHLYHSNPHWTPSWWLVSEVQIPIPNQASQR